VDLRIRHVLAAPGGGLVGAQPALRMPPGAALVQAGRRPATAGPPAPRGCAPAAERGPQGRVPQPVAVIRPGSAKTSRPDPAAPSRHTGAAPPARIAGSRAGSTVARRQEVIGAAVMLPGEQEPSMSAGTAGTPPHRTRTVLAPACSVCAVIKVPAFRYVT